MPSSIRQHGADIGLRDDRAVDPGFAVKPPHGLAAADGAHVILDGVAGHHGLPELALVDGQEVDRARLFGALDRLDADDACGLRHGLDHHHAGIDRALGEMAEETRLVVGAILDADAAVIGADIDDLVDQKHRITGRKGLEDVVDIDPLKPDWCLLHHSRPSSFASLVPSRTSFSTARISRNHCLVGLAKWPPQRPPAGMSSLTALMAVTWAPSPIFRWLLIPTFAPSATLSPMVRLPASPIWAASRQRRPMVTLCPI